MNRVELQDIALRRLEAAKCLLANGHYDSAYYLAGYALECALKAFIARQFREHDFPDKKTVNDSYTHDLRKLVKVAGLEAELSEAQSRSEDFQQNWRIAIAWSEESRYQNAGKGETEDLIRAIEEPVEGVLGWIRERW